MMCDFVVKDTSKKSLERSKFLIPGLKISVGIRYHGLLYFMCRLKIKVAYKFIIIKYEMIKCSQNIDNFIINALVS